MMRSASEVDRALRQTSVVIALKDDERILACLDSVDEPVEIVLALNGTPKRLRNLVASHAAKPIIVEIPDVGNLGGAYNAGIAAAAGRYILLMDSDCLFTAGTIRKMASLICRYPVVKGQVLYDTAPTIISRLIARIREFDEGDYVSALSPPLIYDRQLAEHIGGYHFDPLIHWCEDREFDFRLQMADIPVLYEGTATISHGAQVGVQNLRSYWRYGHGEAIGQELGVFTTPAVPLLWRLLSDVEIVWSCARAKGALAGAYYAMTLVAFHSGTAWHVAADPYRVRHRYPSSARRIRMLRSIPQHCTELTGEQKRRLGERNIWSGRRIVPVHGYRDRLRAVQQELAQASEDSSTSPSNEAGFLSTARGDDPMSGVPPRAPLRLAIVGCGAAARQCHVPGLAGVADVELVALVDPVEDNARSLAALVAGARGSDPRLRIATDLAAVADSVDMAIIASPHASHAELAIAAARLQIHCLVEKPLALSTADCVAMARAATEHGVVLAVAHVRRLFPASRLVKTWLADGIFGQVTSVCWREGAPYDWPLVTPSLFHRRSSGGGVLADGGPHVLDLLLWWLAEGAEVDAVEVIDCADSSLGGAESETRIELRIAGVPVSVLLSRLRPMENTCVLRGTKGSVEIGTDTPATFVRRDQDGLVVADGVVVAVPPAQDGWEPLFSEQLRNFAAAVRGRESIYASADDGRRVVDLLQRCYAVRTPGYYPWRALEVL
jgi:predicted dehydrogenase